MNIRGFVRRLLSENDSTSPTRSLHRQELTRMDDTDEFAAYDAVLGAKYSAERPERFVIARETTSLKESAFIGLWHGRAHVRAQRPEVDAPTSNDLDIKNEATYLLTNRFSVSVPYVLVAWMNCGKFFCQGGQGKPDLARWRRFRGKYPGGQEFLRSLAWDSTKTTTKHSCTPRTRETFPDVGGCERGYFMRFLTPRCNFKLRKHRQSRRLLPGSLPKQ